MAEIVLGIGSSHTPMLNVGREEWPRFAESDPAIERFRDPSGRDRSYAELAALARPDIRPFLTEASFHDRYDRAQAGIATLRERLARARPDAIVIIGDDQQELLSERNMPAFLVYWGKEIESRQIARRLPWDWYNVANTHYFETAPQRYPVVQDLALQIIKTMVERGFDVAASSGLDRDMGENHAIGFVRQRLMADKTVPIVPVLINTFYPPNQPLPRRCYEFGKTLGAAIARWNGARRIAVVASGGLSHFLVDETLDHGVLDMLRRKDAAALSALPPEQLTQGSSEIRNWIAAAGAARKLELDWVSYVAGYRSSALTGVGLCFAHWA